MNINTLPTTSLGTRCGSWRARHTRRYTASRRYRTRALPHPRHERTRASHTLLPARALPPPCHLHTTPRDIARFARCEECRGEFDDALGDALTGRTPIRVDRPCTDAHPSAPSRPSECSPRDHFPRRGTIARCEEVVQESTERSETPLLALTGRVPTRPDQPCTDVHHSAPSDRPNASRPSPQARDARNPTVFWQNTGTVSAGRSRVLRTR